MSTSAAESRPVGYLPTIPPGKQPLALPPPGQTANLEHPESNAIRVYVAASICIPLIVSFAGLRTYNKIYVNPGRALDDYTFMLATVCTIVYISLVIALLSKGLFGTHIWDLTLGDLRNTPFLLVLIIEALWGPTIWLIKLSVFLMYLSLFDVLTWFKRLIWAGIAVSGLLYFSTTVAKLALCAPRGSETYIMAFSTPHCDSTKKLGVASGIFNIISDVYLLVLPVPVVWGLRITNKRKKFGVLAGFMTGFL
ncbi:MAG: hypothetical protein LQ338_007924 [Usnochroma carphineum]|nr:MAG: hypothetical protein LQ338_007924 [Usnochroma carphineum]